MVERSQKFRRNENLELLLAELNELLSPVEKSIIEKYDTPKLPLIFIVGCARSGSTVLMQWLASMGEFAYPTNILSRFYAAPYIGARIQQMLADPKYRHRDEFSDFGSPIDYNSELGKTSGVLEPNEFHYFWWRFFKYDQIQILDNDELMQVDARSFRSELAAIESVFEKPLAMKAMIVNWNLPFIYQTLPNAIFLYTKRDFIYNAQSLLEARDKFYGNRNQWYSFKPPEFPLLQSLSPCEQVAGQVFFTNRAIEQGLSEIALNNKIEIVYEEFCENPKAVYDQIVEKMNNFGCKLPENYNGPNSFLSTNRARLTRDELDQIRSAYENFRRGK